MWHKDYLYHKYIAKIRNDIIMIIRAEKFFFL